MKVNKTCWYRLVGLVGFCGFFTVIEAQAANLSSRVDDILKSIGSGKNLMSEKEKILNSIKLPPNVKSYFSEKLAGIEYKSDAKTLVFSFKEAGSLSNNNCLVGNGGKSANKELNISVDIGKTVTLKDVNIIEESGKHIVSFDPYIEGVTVNKISDGRLNKVAMKIFGTLFKLSHDYARLQWGYNGLKLRCANSVVCKALHKEYTILRYDPNLAAEEEKDITEGGKNNLVMHACK